MRRENCARDLVWLPEQGKQIALTSVDFLGGLILLGVVPNQVKDPVDHEVGDLVEQPPGIYSQATTLAGPLFGLFGRALQRDGDLAQVSAVVEDAFAFALGPGEHVVRCIFAQAGHMRLVHRCDLGVVGEDDVELGVRTSQDA